MGTHNQQKLPEISHESKQPHLNVLKETRNELAAFAEPLGEERMAVYFNQDSTGILVGEADCQLLRQCFAQSSLSGALQTVGFQVRFPINRGVQCQFMRVGEGSGSPPL